MLRSVRFVGMVSTNLNYSVRRQNQGSVGQPITGLDMIQLQFEINGRGFSTPVSMMEEQLVILLAEIIHLEGRVGHLTTHALGQGEIYQ